MHVAASTGRVVAGRYLLQEPIGRGAMGTVWRAWDSVLAREVAVKEVRFRSPASRTGSAQAEDSRVRYERSLREARATARLNHPAVITVFDVVEADGSPWIVMELVEAPSLERVLAGDGPLRPAPTADVGGQLLSALHCAHQSGILHRDVKPSNVLLGPDGRAVLTDFGIATLDGDPELTQAGMVMGTPGFTAPERVRGEPATPASDLWSLGATLFAAVEGHGPFDHRGASMAIWAAIAHEEAPQPRLAGPLGPVIAALLHRDPRERPDAATAARLLSAAVAPGMGAGGMGAGGMGAGGMGANGAGALTVWPEGRGQAWPGPGQRPAEVPATLWDASDAAPAPGGPPPTRGWPAAARAGSPDWPAAAPRANPADRSGPVPVSLAAGIPGRNDRPAAAGGPGSLSAGLPGARPRPSSASAGPDRGGRRGARAALPFSGPRGWLAVLAAAVLAGLIVAAVLAVAHRPAAGAAAGYRTVRMAGNTAGQAAGYSLAVPAAWHTGRHGATSVFTSPDGTAMLQVTPARFGALRPLGEARLLQAVALRRGTFPGYQAITLDTANSPGHGGAVWEFTWQPAQGPRAEVRESLFRLATPAGPQGYLVQESAEVTAWRRTRSAFATALRTFRAQP